MPIDFKIQTLKMKKILVTTILLLPVDKLLARAIKLKLKPGLR